jgi:hypothetical protein
MLHGLGIAPRRTQQVRRVLRSVASRCRSPI